MDFSGDPRKSEECMNLTSSCSMIHFSTIELYVQQDPNNLTLQSNLLSYRKPIANYIIYDLLEITLFWNMVNIWINAEEVDSAAVVV